jgi:plasmid maintenance system antidote protein VapI
MKISIHLGNILLKELLQLTDILQNTMAETFEFFCDQSDFVALARNRKQLVSGI